MENSHLLRDEHDIALIRELIKRLGPESTLVDFEENIQMRTVQTTLRLWQQDGVLAGFAYVDDFDDLHFEVAPELRSSRLEDEIIAWGIACIQERSRITGENHTLDACFSKKDAWQIALLERSGFVRTEFRSFGYARSLTKPVDRAVLPPGFSFRCVAGEHEVEQLVALHRAAFGTNQMTVEERLAIMRAPGYARELDLLAVAPGGELAAFCICSLAPETEKETVGYTDPIGVHPRYQRLGMGKAIVMAGLNALQQRGVKLVKLGTSSENIPMQRLAETMGFACVSEKIWFSKFVS